MEEGCNQSLKGASDVIFYFACLRGRFTPDGSVSRFGIRVLHGVIISPPLFIMESISFSTGTGTEHGVGTSQR